MDQEGQREPLSATLQLLGVSISPDVHESMHSTQTRVQHALKAMWHGMTKSFHVPLHGQKEDIVSVECLQNKYDGERFSEGFRSEQIIKHGEAKIFNAKYEFLDLAERNIFCSISINEEPYTSIRVEVPLVHERPNQQIEQDGVALHFAWKDVKFSSSSVDKVYTLTRTLGELVIGLITPLTYVIRAVIAPRRAPCFQLQ